MGGGVVVSHNTARSWLTVLEGGYVLQRLPPLHRNLRKRVVKAPKLHFLDSGLACWLLGIRSPDELRRHPLRGALMETWVASEVTKAFTNRGVRPRLHHWRNRRGQEVDLVVDRGRDLLAVEVKSDATVHPSFFTDLEHFAALAREAVPAPPEGVRRVLVYGGRDRQERSAGLVLPWREVQGYGWVEGERGAGEWEIGSVPGTAGAESKHPAIPMLLAVQIDSLHQLLEADRRNAPCATLTPIRTGFHRRLDPTPTWPAQISWYASFAPLPVETSPFSARRWRR